MRIHLIIFWIICINIVYSQSVRFSKHSNLGLNYQYSNLEINKEMILAVSWNGMLDSDYFSSVLFKDIHFYTELSEPKPFPLVVNFFELVKSKSFDSIRNVWVIGRDPLNFLPDKISRINYPYCTSFGDFVSLDYSNYYMDYFLKFIITDEDLNSKKMCYPPDSFTIFPENHFILPLTNIKYKSFNSNFNANVKYANEVFIFRCRVTFLPVKAKLYEFPNLHLKTHVGDENYIRYRSEVKLNYLPKGLDYGGYYLTVERKVLYNYIYNITDIIPLSKAEIRQVLENDASLNTLQLRILKKWNPSIFN